MSGSRGVLLLLGGATLFLPPLQLLLRRRRFCVFPVARAFFQCLFLATRNISADLDRCGGYFFKQLSRKIVPKSVVAAGGDAKIERFG